MSGVHAAVNAWHACVNARDTSGLHTLLADDVTFWSPVVHSPQQGKAITAAYLTAALHVLGGADWRYVREIVSDAGAMLEFETTVDGITINGVDIIAANAAGQITDFKVMVRPLKAVNMLHAKMAEMLEQMKRR
jgi:ketosteroid isomerase-like protein